jgi:hypothetical protein
MRSQTRTLQPRTHKSFSVSLSSERSGGKLPVLQLSSLERRKAPNNFDRYYIHPALRYRVRKENPKANPENYQDETFIYKNLHNQSFWNWVHPLESVQLKHQKNTISHRVNTSVLHRFKASIANRTNRVPILVEEILNSQEV